MEMSKNIIQTGNLLLPMKYIVLKPSPRINSATNITTRVICYVKLTYIIHRKIEIVITVNFTHRKTEFVVTVNFTQKDSASEKVCS